jgi:hypothetical protein
VPTEKQLANLKANAGRGRPKGVPNKTTASVREVWIGAFDDLGGQAALVRWARKNQTAFYQSVTRLFPLQVNAEVSGALEIIHRSE